MGSLLSLLLNEAVDTSSLVVSLINIFPKELKEELTRYSYPFSFVLKKTGLFPDQMESYEHSRKHLCTWASEQEYLSLLWWARINGCPYRKAIIIGNRNDDDVFDDVISIGNGFANPGIRFEYT